MKKFHCECCGAALPIPKSYEKYIKCEYCNATYEIDNSKSNDTLILEPHYILVAQGHIQKLRAKIAVEEEKLHYFPPEAIEKYVRESLAAQIMEYLMPNLHIMENYDIKDFARIYQTTIYLDTHIT